MTDEERPKAAGTEGRPTERDPGRGLSFVTSNDDKYRQAVEVLGPEVSLERAPVDVPELQSTDPAAVVRHKAKAAYTTVGSPVLVDDFSFFLDGLNSFPGPLVKHLLSETGLRGIRGLSLVAEGGCTFRCTVATWDGKNSLVTTGDLRGSLRLPTEGMDPSANMPLSTVFVPEGHDRPLAELSIPSHRHRAYTRLKERLLG